ncbi:FAS1 domain-containing protein [Chloropicon primus]|nr:FAS1 domain-containing protein [Chloropicon primus]
MMRRTSIALIAALLVVVTAVPLGHAATRTLLDDAGDFKQGSDECIYQNSTDSIVSIATGNEDFSTLVAALKAADLVGAFDDNSQKVTVFAPTNEAFEKFFTATGLKPEDVLANKELLTEVLKYHVSGKVFPAPIASGTEIPTLEGTSLTEGADGTIAAAGSNATITTPNVYACNGVVQIIDAVLIPQVALDALAGASNDTEAAPATNDTAPATNDTEPEAPVSDDGRRSLLQTREDAQDIGEFAVGPADQAIDAVQGAETVAEEAQEIATEEGTAAMPSDPALEEGTAAMPSDPALEEGTATMPSDPALEEGTAVMPIVDNATEAGDANATIPVVPVVPADGDFKQGSDECIYQNSTDSIVSIATGNEDFSTLVAALKAADLVGAFDDNSQKVTVFAPTNEAFEKFFTATGLKPEDVLANKELLTEVLKYHVSGKVFPAPIASGTEIPTLEGTSLTAGDDNTIIAAGSNATITTPNVYACNGVVQIIDAVLIPQVALDALAGASNDTEGGRRSLLQFDAPPTTDEIPAPVTDNATEPEAPAADATPVAADATPVAADATPVADATPDAAPEASAYNQGSDECIYSDHTATLVETAAGVPDFSTLVAALKAADLVGAFDDNSQKVTVFAPTNEAFDKLFSEFNVTAEEVLGNKKFLADVLKYHVSGQVYPFSSLADGEEIATLLKGESLGVSTSQVQNTVYSFGFPIGTTASESVTLLGGATNATIVQGNVWACNAVIQVIDSVLVPQSAISSDQ